MKSRLCVLLTVAMSSASFSQTADEQRMLEVLLSGRSPLSKLELARQIENAQQFPLGSKDNPVRVEQPAGEHAYLRRLRCPDGKAPGYQRRGSTGGGPFGTLLDHYVLDCGANAPATVEVMMDMYHRGHVENRPVPGFTIIAP